MERLEARRLLASTPFNIDDYPTLPAIVNVGSGSLTSVLPPGEPAPSPAPRVTSDFTGPVAAAEWWSSIAFSTNTNSEPIFSHPMATRTHSDGLAVGYPRDPIVYPTGYRYLYDENLRIKLDGFNSTGARVAGYSDWTVTTRWENGADRLETTFGHGLPFVYATRQGTRDAVIQFDQSVTVWSNAGGVARVTIQGKHYGLFGPSTSQWVQAGNTFKNNLSGNDFFSVALLPDSSAATFEFFRQRAYAFVTNTEVSWNYDSSTSTSNATYAATTELKESGGGRINETLMALYRHQWLNSPSPLTSYSYNSSRGQMKVASGNSFTTAMTHHGTLPVMPEVGADPTQLYTYIDQVYQQNSLITTSDSYFTGTDIYKIAQLIPLAEQVGHTQARDRFLSEVRSELEDWFDATDGGDAQFYYSQSWDTLIGYPDSFGSAEDLNDHHFHYGYFIQSAAIVALYDPQWAQEGNWGGMVEVLIRDVADWERDDKTFQFLRNFDIYAGHSWASGNAKFERGNNQESSSEAMNFAAGIILWGSAVGDDAMRDLGIYMSTTHQAALEQYWFDIDDVVFNPAYPHPMVGILWSDGVDYATFFSGSPEHIQGINYLPLNGGSLYLGHDPAYVQASYDHVVNQNGGPVDEWTDLMFSYLAFADPATALANFNASPSSDIQPLAKNYHWISSLNALGQVDPTVTADIPSYAVFDKAGVKTYVAYNPTNTAITANYSDGTMVSVPAFTFVTSGGNTFSWRAGQQLLVTSDELGISEAGGTANITVTRSGDTTASLDVTLTSSDTDQAIVSGLATRMIPAGQVSATFTIAAVDDLMIDGTHVVTFATTAIGFSSRFVDVAVTDDEPSGGGISDRLYLIDHDVASLDYFLDFQSLEQTSQTALSAEGWEVFSDNAGLGNYNIPAPNASSGGGQISAIADDGAGNQFLNFYANYDNSAVHANPPRKEAISFYYNQPFTSAEATLSETWNFDFDYARNPSAPPSGATQVGAFIRVFDGSFNLLDQQTFDTIGATNVFTAAPALTQTLNPAWVNGGFIQFGFNNHVGSYDGSGMFYDNVRFANRAGPLSAEPGIGARSDSVPETSASHVGTPFQPIEYSLSGINGIYDSNRSTQFGLYLDAAQNVGSASQARVSYDFTGDGSFDRIETYNYFATDPIIGWEHYSDASGISSQSGNITNFSNGTVKLELWKAFGDGDAEVRTSATNAEGQQSSLLIPFFVQNDSVRVEFAADESSDVESIGGNTPRLLVSGTLTAPATIDASVVGGTATLGTDFSHTATVNIPAGVYDGTLATSISINLSIIDENDPELNESIEFSLSNPSPAISIHDANGDNIVQKPHVYRIFDDDHSAGEFVADFRFETDFDVTSSDVHLETMASTISSGGALIASSPSGNPSRSLLLGASWDESSDVGPTTTSTDYLTFTVTPDAGQSLTPAELTFDVFRDASDSIRHYAIYADDDTGMNPGAGGNDFATKIGSGSLSAIGTWTTARIPLGGVPFLQQTQSPTAFRLYFWGDAGVGSVARIDNVRLSEVGVPNSPQVESVVLNSGAAQRSSLTSIAVTFDGLVSAPASAFAITNLGLPAGTANIAVTGLSVTTHQNAGQTVATITFGAGTSVIDRSTINTLADGNYRLDIDGSQIIADGSMQTMQQDFVFGSESSDNFFRFFGDENGDGNTDFNDFSLGFLPAFGTGVGSNGYRDEFDADGDGDVDFDDFKDGFLPNFGSGR